MCKEKDMNANECRHIVTWSGSDEISLETGQGQSGRRVVGNEVLKRKTELLTSVVGEVLKRKKGAFELGEMKTSNVLSLSLGVMYVLR